MMYLHPKPENPKVSQRRIAFALCATSDGGAPDREALQDDGSKGWGSGAEDGRLHLVGETRRPSRQGAEQGEKEEGPVHIHRSKRCDWQVYQEAGRQGSNHRTGGGRAHIIQ